MAALTELPAAPARIDPGDGTRRRGARQRRRPVPEPGGRQLSAVAPTRRVPPSTRVRSLPPTPSLAERLIVELATASEVPAAMTRLVTALRRAGRLERAEWWAPTDDGRSLRLAAADGSGPGHRTAFPLGPAGALVLVGDGLAELAPAVTRVVPLVRRRWTEEQLARQVTRLARENEALEDFAALVAHELKSTLYAMRGRADPPRGVEGAIELVESILEVARSESGSDSRASADDCLSEALEDLGPIDAEVVADLGAEVPISPPALRLVLRNLVANAVAAGAHRIRVSMTTAEDRLLLVVDDDGVGLDAASGYAAGSRLGLSLCRRLVARFGGALELKPRARGGTRATVLLTGGE